MFARDELDEITQGLIAVMKKELPRVPPTNDNLYNYFISRSRKNLHVVLCFSPVSVLLTFRLIAAHDSKAVPTFGFMTLNGKSSVSAINCSYRLINESVKLLAGRREIP